MTWLLFQDKHFPWRFLFTLDLPIAMVTAAWGSVVPHLTTVPSTKDMCIWLPRTPHMRLKDSMWNYTFSKAINIMQRFGVSLCHHLSIQHK